ncbi:TIR domain-containing protein [Gordonia sp. NPDC062954]|uniref:TIR domain-containing protein n=1 Tax=Gordonia sp. NPDC062954 TaxID=3364003 RepID=UPI0037C65FDA
MADIAISYSHRDSDLARWIESHAVAAGHTVWLDDPGERSTYGAGITLPSGQSHWDVISREFVNAGMIIVAATPNWENSEYCRREYQLAREWGKWVVFVGASGWDAPATPLTELPAAMEALGRFGSVANAHARLADSARQADHGHRPGLIERTLRRSEASDAKLVTEHAAQLPWHPLTPPIDAHIRDVLERDHHTRRRLKRTGVATVAILAVLALAGAGAWGVAFVAQQAAEEDAAKAQSIALIAQSEAESDTMRAVELAEEAVALHEDNASANGLAVARDRDNRLRRTFVRPGPYFSLALAPSGTRAAAASLESIHVFDRDTGTGIQTIDESIRSHPNSLVFTPNGDRILFITRDRDLVSASVSDGSRTRVAVDVDTVAAGGSTMWWSSGNTLVSSGFDGSNRSETSLTTPLDSIAVSSDGMLIDAVDEESRLIEFDIAGGSAAERRSRVIGGENGEIEAGSGAHSVVKRCGSRVFGIFEDETGVMSGTEFIATDDQITTDRSRNNPQTPVCWGEADAWGADLYGTRWTLADGPAPYIPGLHRRLAIARDSVRLYALSPEGHLFSMTSSAAAISGDVDGVLAVVPTKHATFGLTAAGGVVDIGSGHSTSAAGHRFLANELAVGSSGAAVLVDRGVVAIDDSGRVSAVPDINVPDLVEIAANVDGERFLLVYQNLIEEFDVKGVPARSFTLPWLAADESAASASISPDGSKLAVATTNGRVAVLEVDDLSHPEFVDAVSSRSATTTVAFTVADDLLVTTPEGQLRLFDSTLESKATALFGAPAKVVHIVGDRVLVTADSIGAAVYRTADLSAVAKIDESTALAFSLRLTIPAPDSPGGSIVGTRFSNASTAEGSRLITVPLPPE